MTANWALDVHFEGYFLCRLTTDPDPTDEPRGVSGYTLALAGESNLDNWIQLNPSAEYVRQNFREPGRSLAEQGKINLGVKVTGTTPGPEQVPAAALIGLPVNLLTDATTGAPKFEGRNDIVGSDDTISFAIDPFILDISNPDGSVKINRQDLLPNGNAPIWRLPPEAYQDRVGHLVDSSDDNAPGPLDVLEAIGVYDFYGYFRDRSRWIEAQLARTRDSDEIQRLKTRLNAIDFFGDRIRSRLGLKCEWSFKIGGGSVGTVVGLPGIDTTTPWPVTFWMGGFDGDLMIGYMRGTLTLPRVSTSATV